MFSLAFLQKNLRWLLAGFILTFSSSFGQTFFISLSAGEIRESFALSHGGFGLIYMIATLASAATLPFLGQILDTLKVKTVVLLVYPLLALACLIMAVAMNAPLKTTLAVVGLGGGIYLLRLFGQGMMMHTSQTAIARWFVATRGQALAVTGIGVTTGEAILPLVFVTLVAIFGWMTMWAATAAVLVLVILPTVFLLTAQPRQPRADEKPTRPAARVNWTRAEVMRDPLFWIILLAALAPGFIGTVIFFHQVYLVELRGWSPQIFAVAFTVMAFMSMSAALVFGRLVDKYSAVRIFPWVLLPLGLAALLLSIGTASWMAYVFMGLLGVSIGFTNTLLGALWPEVYGLKHLGAIRSMVVALVVFSTAAGPGITGYLIDIGVAYPAQIAVMGVSCFVITIILFPVRRRLIARLAV